MLPTGSPLANLLNQVPQQWRTVYQDKAAVVMQQRSEGEP